MQKQAYPYCVHGVYVGGCGVDYMCMSCELGDIPPSLADLRSYVRHCYAEVAKALDLIAPHVLTKWGPAFWEASVPKKLAKLKIAQRDVQEVERWALDEDDQSWLYRRHDARVAEWDRQSGDDQFWSLPADVLDGP